jgi:HD-GYP domain-containing protein (c-di-GMP phosphodiesterase class II)
MTSNRPYRNAIDRKNAKNELRRNVDVQFDPEVVTALFKALERDEIG